MENTFSGADAFHGFLGCHDRLYNKLDAKKKRHKYGKTAHGGVWHQTGSQASHESEKQNRGHHDDSVADIKIFVFSVGIRADSACKHVACQCDSDGFVGREPKKGN